MAPKKNVDKTTTPTKKITQEKVKKPRIKKEKPKFNTPSIVKLKLPITKTLHNAVTASEEPKVPPLRLKMTPKAINAEKRKIELANEVALSQLIKISKTESLEPPSDKNKKRRKRKLDTDVIVQINEEPTTSVAKKNTKKPVKLIRKKIEPINKPPATTNKRKADSTSKTDTKKPKIVKTKSMTKPKEQPTIQKKLVKNVRGKKADDIASSDVQFSPSILDPNRRTAFENENENIINESPNIVVVDPQDTSPVKVNSRKTSLASSSECLSWTKDISSSSTTTCLTVGSNDFVKIGKKIPIIRLSNIDSQLRKAALKETIKIENENDDAASVKTDESDKYMINPTLIREETENCNSSSSSLSSSGSSDSTPRGSISPSPDRNTFPHSPNLSTSSISPAKSHSTTFTRDSHQTVGTKDDISKIGYALDKLSSKLKKLDLEIINWIGYEHENTDTNVKIFQEKIFKVLKEENEVIIQCRNLKRILSNNNTGIGDGIVGVAAETSHSEEVRDEENFMKPKDVDVTPPVVDKSEDDDNFTSTSSRYVMLQQNYSYNDEPLLPTKLDSDSSESDENFTSRVRYMPLDQSYNNDDDDALSLFAESITGMESSRLQSSVGSVCVSTTGIEEYIPQPISKESQLSSGLNYRPTKITSNLIEEVPQNCKIKAICEKQNADSTSINKESDSELRQHTETPEANGKHTGSTETALCPNQNAVSNKPTRCLMASLYKPINAVKSYVFKGVCFFNLISNCKRLRCLFPHVPLALTEVQNRLSKLSEEQFIQEYILLRNFPELRKIYGMFYVQECHKRELTRILVEMALDFVTKTKIINSETKSLTIDVMEQVLMHLTKVDLSQCDDLLLFNLGQNRILCDAFMETLADTQNFSRFKFIFIKLSAFMINAKRTFDSKVAGQILERVCILPFDTAVAKAVVSIIKHTDDTIFENAMMDQFEKQLASNDEALYVELMTYKGHELENPPSVRNLFGTSPHLSQEIDQTNKTQLDQDQRYTSPDTTKLDTMNKAVDEPIITRTVDLSRLKAFTNAQSPNTSSSASNDSEDYRPTKQSKFKHWRPAFISPRFSGRRQVFNGPLPSKYIRRSRPDF